MSFRILIFCPLPFVHFKVIVNDFSLYRNQASSSSIREQRQHKHKTLGYWWIQRTYVLNDFLGLLQTEQTENDRNRRFKESHTPSPFSPFSSVQLLKLTDLGRHSLLYLREIGNGWFGKVSPLITPHISSLDCSTTAALTTKTPAPKVERSYQPWTIRCCFWVLNITDW